MVRSASEAALVLAGAVAKGAFEAGALEVAHRKGWRFSRVVAASSGAINGAYWAAAVRAGREDDAARKLPAIWLSRADLRIFHISLSGLLGEQGLSTGKNIAALLEEEVESWLPGLRHPAGLRLIVTPLGGAEGNIGGAPATTFQRVLSFDDQAFDTRERRAAVFRAAEASAAFPGVFVPVDLPGSNACVDGGTVNNTPTKEAIAGGKINRVLVVAPYPLISAMPRARFNGLALMGRLADILINERLYRDLREAESVNETLRSLEALHRRRTLTQAQLKKVKRAIGREAARRIEFVQVRPRKGLPGNPFSGFFSRKLRDEYVQAGRAAAERAL